MYRWFFDPEVRKVLFLTLVLKLLAFAVIAAGAFFLPFNTANYYANFHFPPFQSPDFWTRFKTWDAQHYLYLAQFGYKPHLPSDAFYPLYPFLIRILGGWLGGNEWVVGLFLSTLFNLVAMVFLYRLLRELYGESLAWRTVVLFLTFPMTFFLGLIYADSFFLMLAVLFFYGWLKEEKKILLVSVFLLPWVKPIGILLSPALVLLLFFKEYRPKAALIEGAIFTNLLGFALYLAYMSRVLGDPWAAFAAQQKFLSGYSVQTYFHPVDWLLKNFVQVHWTLNGPLDGALSRVMFLALLPLLVLVYQRLDPVFFTYTLVLGLASALAGDLMSFPRYWLVLFPLFMVLAMELKSARWWVWVLGGLLQAFLLLLHSVNDWVA